MRSKTAQTNKLVVTPSKHLFWFLQEGVRLDLSDPSTLDMCVQQIITRGRTDDVKSILKMVDAELLKKVLKRIERFIPAEVRDFWEDFIGSHQ